MPVPSRDDLLQWAENYVALWNAGDKPAWEANWRRVAPGDFRMHDPVGTPEKRGFQECAADAFDLFQPKVRFRIVPGSLFACGNEVAWLLENRFDTGDRETIGRSIETYRFGKDGSVTIRTWYDVPDHDDEALGELFQEYLPEGGPR
jgi:hypothetical protein